MHYIEKLFISLDCPEILKLIDRCDDLKKLVAEDESIARKTLKNVFTKVWSSKPEDISKAVKAMVERLETLPGQSILLKYTPAAL